MGKSQYKSSELRRLPLCVATTIASALPVFVSAAEPISEVSKGPSGPALEEVVVTAQRRSQTLMEVPISVSVFSAEDIEKTGALDIREMSNYISGMTVDEAQVTQASITIRGISSTNVSSGGDPSVATFYDGSYLPRSATTIGFADVERIEVLKGPQGTLFGRNAAAGVVNIVPTRPQEETDGFIAAKIGNYSLWRFEGMGNIELVDGLAFRANFLTNNRDGFIDNVAPQGDDVGEQNSTTARAALLWTISDATDVMLSYDYDKVDQSAQSAIGVGPYAYSSDPFDGKVENDVLDGGETRDMYAVGFKLNHTFNEYWSSNYKASYRDIDTENVFDEDGTSDITRYLSADNVEDTDIFYTELQVNFVNDSMSLVMGGSYSYTDSYQEIPVNLSSDSLARFVTGQLNDEFGTFFDEPLDHIWKPDDWAEVTGLLNDLGFDVPEDQSDESYKAVAELAGEPLIFGPSYAGQRYNETVFNDGEFTSWGVFADLGYNLTEKLEVFLGIRYSYDKKKFSWETPLTSFAGANPELGITANGIFSVQEKVKVTDDWDDTTGRVVVNYHLTDDIMTFASYSTGYKSGGYDSLDVRTAEFPLDPEDVTNYEVGIKADLFDQRMRVQLSAYDLDVDGAQELVDTNPPDGEDVVIPRLINNDKTNKGVELTLDWYVFESLLFGLITQYVESEQTPEQYYDAEGNLAGGERSEGKSKPWDNYTLKLDWMPVIPVGSVVFHMDYVYVTNDSSLDLNYLEKYDDIPGYGGDRERLQARIDWRSDDQKYEVAIWGKNLLDKKYVSDVGGRGQEVFDAPKVSVEDPLTYGVDLRYRF